MMGLPRGQRCSLRSGPLFVDDQSAMQVIGIWLQDARTGSMGPLCLEDSGRYADIVFALLSCLS
jgi:hypothetical protein